MDTGTVELLAKYNAAANAEMDALIEKLSPAQWEKEFKGYFSSIKSMCNHIYIGDFNWLKRFSRLRAFSYASDPLFARDIAFTESVIGAVPDYLAKRRTLDALIRRFAEEAEQDDLERDLVYFDSRGAEYRRNFGGLVLHMFNHQTHHRGMISLYLEEQGIPNDFSNLCGIL